MKFVIACTASLLSFSLLAQERVVRLYDGPAPGSESWTQEEKENRRVVYNVSQPTLTISLPDPSIATGTAVVICPGGGFYLLSIDSEGFDVARWLSPEYLPATPVDPFQGRILVYQKKGLGYTLRSPEAKSGLGRHSQIRPRGLLIEVFAPPNARP